MTDRSELSAGRAALRGPVPAIAAGFPRVALGASRRLRFIAGKSNLHLYIYILVSAVSVPAQCLLHVRERSLHAALLVELAVCALWMASNLQLCRRLVTDCPGFTSVVRTSLSRAELIGLGALSALLLIFRDLPADAVLSSGVALLMASIALTITFILVFWYPSSGPMLRSYLLFAAAPIAVCSLRSVMGHGLDPLGNLLMAASALYLLLCVPAKFSLPPLAGAARVVDESLLLEHLVGLNAELRQATGVYFGDKPVPSPLGWLS